MGVASSKHEEKGPPKGIFKRNSRGRLKSCLCTLLLDGAPEGEEIFRTSPLNVVLSGCCSVFAEVLGGQVAASGNQDTTHAPVRAPLKSLAYIETGTDEEEHRFADTVWNGTLVSNRADGFVSHVWVASRWLKWLGLQMAFFKDHALYLMIASTALVFGWLLVRCGFDIRHADFYADDWLMWKCIYLPTLVFLVTTLFGQHIPGLSSSRNLWVDKTCIHQTRPEIKVKGVSEIHKFVGWSDRIYILWSETYFERLWCMCELGTFSSIHGPEMIVFIPLWFSPFVLGGHLLSLLFVILSGYNVSLVNEGAAWAAENISPGSGQIVGVFLTVFCGCLPGLVPYLAIFVYKVRSSSAMMDQFETRWVLTHVITL